ncbi:MAG: hypothetical protein ABI609_04130 [Acidobacteriota bacterium]
MSETVTANDCQPPADIAQPRGIALGVAVIATALAGIGGFLNPDQFFKSYLLGYLLMLGLACGCLGLCLLHHMSRGAWGLMLRRVWEAAIKTLPVVALLFIPILLGREHIFSWMRPGAMDDPLLKSKEAYLNLPFFIGRAAFYFAAWIGLGFGLVRLSKKQDETADPSLFRRMQVIAGPGIVLFSLTVTFAAFDWVMSLDPKWFSSIFGLIVLIGQGLSALAFGTLIIGFLGKREPMSRYVTPTNLHDYGKLTLAFTMVWAYFSFSQLLIIWSANLPEEVTFFVHRVGPWKPISIALAVTHFLLPFVLLLSRDIKRSARTLARVAVLILIARWVDLYWYIGPVLHPGSVLPHWLDIVLPVALVSAWTWMFFGFLSKRPLLPFNDPFLTEALTHDSAH